ncbi:MAG TPA: hypothetical protein VK968_02585, partial [Roseimicrobium sp.]|nr:hypothetical protein [Roseimicrobium sp.]
MNPLSKSSAILLTILALVLAIVLVRTGWNRSEGSSGADGAGLQRSTAEEPDTALFSVLRTSTLLSAPKAARGEKTNGKWTFKDSLAS